MQSTPGELFSFMLVILLATPSGVIIYCPDISDLGPENDVTGVGNGLISSLANAEQHRIVLQWSHLLFDFVLCANLYSKFRLYFLTSSVAELSVYLYTM